MVSKILSDEILSDKVLIFFALNLINQIWIERLKHKDIVLLKRCFSDKQYFNIGSHYAIPLYTIAKIAKANFSIPTYFSLSLALICKCSHRVVPLKLLFQYRVFQCFYRSTHFLVLIMIWIPNMVTTFNDDNCDAQIKRKDGTYQLFDSGGLLQGVPETAKLQKTPIETGSRTQKLQVTKQFQSTHKQNLFKKLINKAKITPKSQTTYNTIGLQQRISLPQAARNPKFSLKSFKVT